MFTLWLVLGLITMLHGWLTLQNIDVCYKSGVDCRLWSWLTLGEFVGGIGCLGFGSWQLFVWLMERVRG